MASKFKDVRVGDWVELTYRFEVTDLDTYEENPALLAKNNTYGTSNLVSCTITEPPLPTEPGVCFKAEISCNDDVFYTGMLFSTRVGDLPPKYVNARGEIFNFGDLQYTIKRLD